MTSTYTGKYTKTSTGYMGQLVEWPEVVTEGATLEECRELLKDALQEMITAYRQEGKEIPLGGALLEQVAVETQRDRQAKRSNQVPRAKRLCSSARGWEAFHLHQRTQDHPCQTSSNARSNHGERNLQTGGAEATVLKATDILGSQQRWLCVGFDREQRYPIPA